MNNEEKDESPIQSKTECEIANQLQAEGYPVKQVDGILIIPVEDPSQITQGEV